MNLSKYIPILDWLPKYQKRYFRKDLIAGLTVAVMLVPQGMAYSILAGMPPIYGLYTGLVPLFLYAILGTSRQMSIGPVAISSLLVLAGVSQVAEPMSAEFIGLVILAGMLIGLIQMLLGLFRMGFLVNFISHPVIIGFTSGAAIIIAVSQLKYFFGFQIPGFDHIYDTVVYAFQNISQTNVYSLALCLGSIIVILILKKINKSIPGALIVVIIGTLVVYWIQRSSISISIDIVGAVPKGLPAFQFPVFTLENVIKLLPTLFTVTIIEIVESISIAKVLQGKHLDYDIRPDQELLALGVSKFGGSFFQAIPSSGSFTRSAVNDDSGAQTGIASIITALIIGLVLVFLTPLFYFMPKAVFAAIILLAVFNLFDWEAAKHLWHTDRFDFYMMLITFITTLIIGTEYGILTGVILSVMVVLYRSSKPHVAVLGKLPASNSYRNIHRFENVEQADDILVIRFDDQLYFGNADYFQDVIKAMVNERGDSIKSLTLDASSIHDIDSTGMLALVSLFKFLKSRNINLFLSGVIGPVRDKLLNSGLMQMIGEKNHFLNIHEAVTFHQNLQSGLVDKWSPHAIQSNLGKDANGTK